MRDYDYMITVDRDGHPIICHTDVRTSGSGGGTAKGSQRKDHKYLARIIDKGKYLYFYTQQELNNYYNRGERAAKAQAANAKNRLNRAKRVIDKKIDNVRDAVVNKARDVAGYDERERLEKAQKDYEARPNRANADKLSKAQADYDKTPLAKGTAVKSRTERMKDDLNKLRDRVTDKARDAAGYDERERLEKAQKDYEARPTRANADKLSKAQADYDKTALSKAERLGNKARDVVGDVRDDVREAAGNVRDRVTDKARDVAGYDERERLQKALDDYDARPSRANEEKLRKAQEDYDKTALGMRDRAGRKVDDIADAARESLRNTGASVRGAATGLRDRAADALGFDEREALDKAQRERASARFAQMSEEDAVKRTADRRKAAGEALAKAIEDRNLSEAEYREQINKVSALFTPKKNRELQKKYEDAQAEFEDARSKYQDTSFWDDAHRVTLSKAEERLDKAEAEYAAAEAKYNRTVVGKIDKAIQALGDAPEKVKTITAAQAEKLQAQLNSGKELAQNEMNQLMSFLFQNYKD